MTKLINPENKDPIRLTRMTNKHICSLLRDRRAPIKLKYGNKAIDDLVLASGTRVLSKKKGVLLELVLVRHSHDAIAQRLASGLSPWQRASTCTAIFQCDILPSSTKVSRTHSSAWAIITHLATDDRGGAARAPAGDRISLSIALSPRPQYTTGKTWSHLRSRNHSAVTPYIPCMAWS